MNQQFFTALEARLTELTEDLRYLHRPSGELKAPQIIGVMLDRPTGEVEEAQEYPFVRWVLSDGEFTRLSPAPFSIMLDGGIYTDGTVDDGNAAACGLCMALGKIVEKPWFRPYKLRNRVRFVMGDPGTESNNHGLQPHPYYYCRLYLEFLVAQGHGG